MATVFKINSTDSIVCDSVRTRSGFAHVVKYVGRGLVRATAKVNYYNRTWESFEFETAISKLLSGMGFSPDDKNKIMAVCRRQSEGATDRMFSTVGAFASLGDVFGKTQEEKNKWKARALTHGLPGLELPDDWDKLSEAEKARRLNKVISFTRRKRR